MYHNHIPVNFMIFGHFFIEYSTTFYSNFRKNIGTVSPKSFSYLHSAYLNGHH